MFKNYKDLCDVVSLLVYCTTDRTYLFTKETSGETWLPSSKCENNSWKNTTHKIFFELFGMDVGTGCHPMRVSKVWVPDHEKQSVYHAVYKAAIKIELKKRLKNKAVGMRNRLQWLNAMELQRQRAHCNLRSPEILLFALMVFSDGKNSDDKMEIESGTLVEICEDNVVIKVDVAGGAALESPNHQLLQAAGYNRDDQIRMYREFVLMVFPALYMSIHVFSQFMIDLGWQRSQCQSLFRAADVTGRGGLSFLELMLWTAAVEPTTQHTGVTADIRCRYIFRYFDMNRDLKLEYEEFKELVAAIRSSRQQPVDALSVAREADTCLRQLGLQPDNRLPLADFLRGTSELRLRGTSNLMRAPRSVSAYIVDLQERIKVPASVSASTSKQQAFAGMPGAVPGGAGVLARYQPQAEYRLAMHTVRMGRRTPHELIKLHSFDEDAVSPSTTGLLKLGVHSGEVLGPSCVPVEAIAAVHYFATAIEKQHSTRRQSSVPIMVKPAWAWASAAEEAALGALLLQLAGAVRPLCAAEPRLLRVSSPVYAVGDLHGNLSALLAMENALWPSGTAMAATRILFLGDYVDRGCHGTELMAYLLAAKLQRPEAVLLVRGNHEIRDIQKMFTFYNECIGKYGDIEGLKIWNAINNVFDVLPLAAVIDDKVFCCHGGIPPPWVCPLITAIDKVPVPLSRPAEQSSIAWELLWNDPIKPNKTTATLQLELASNEGFATNVKRGTGHMFDQTALDRFLLANQLSHVVRAHEMHQNGFMTQQSNRMTDEPALALGCGYRHKEWTERYPPEFLSVYVYILNN